MIAPRPFHANRGLQVRVFAAIFVLIAGSVQASLIANLHPPDFDHLTRIGRWNFGFRGYSFEPSGFDYTDVYYGEGYWTIRSPYQSVVAGFALVPLLGIVGVGFILRRRRA